MKKTAFVLSLITCLLFLTSNQSNAQIISTIAGNETYTYTGDGGPATSAGISEPYGLAFDASGNLYCSSYVDNVVRRVNTSGIISTVVGSGAAGFSGDGAQATAAQLSGPREIIMDPLGNLYIADYGNNRIRKVTTSGIISTIVGTGTASFSGDGGQATSATIYGPMALALDLTGNLYIAEYGNNRVRKVNTLGVISTVAGNGNPNYTGDGGQATSAEINQPWGLTVDAIGNLYISDYGNNRIRKVNTAGIISTIVGTNTGTYAGDGGPATAADIASPTGIIFDAAGNFYLADNGTNTVRYINTAGIIYTRAGNGTRGLTGDGGIATLAELDQPEGIAFDSKGNLFIADYSSHRIRVVTMPLPVTVNSATLCTNVGSATLTANGATTFTWSPATGLNVTTGSVVIANPTVTTIYTVTGTSTSTILGNTEISEGIATSIITVYPSPLVVNSPSMCAGATTTLSVTGATTYSWTPATGLSATTGSVVTANPSTTETYTITGTTGTCTNSITSTITVNPNLIIVNSPSICAGSTATLSVSGATTYSWTPPTGLSATTGSVVTSNTSTTKTYTVTGITGSCNRKAQSTVTVNPLPTVTVNNGTICAGSSFTISPSGANTYTYSSGNAIVTPTSNTTYTVTGTNTVTTCANNAVSTVTVNPLPTITANSTTVCEGNTTTTLTASGSATSYSWNTGSTTPSITISPTVTTDYNVTGMDINNCINTITSTVTVNNPTTATINPVGCTSITVNATTYTTTSTYIQNLTNSVGCDSTLTINATINSLPTLTITASSATICAGSTTTLTASGATTYTWSNTGTTAITILNTPTVTTQYTVTGTDGNNCINNDTLTVMVENCTTDIKRLVNNGQVTVYPNPNNGMFSIITNTNQNVQCTMYDVNGKLVLSQTITNGKADIDASAISNGVYNISLISSEGVVNKRLVITR